MLNNHLQNFAQFCLIGVCFFWGITLYIKNRNKKLPGYYMAFVQWFAGTLFFCLIPLSNKNLSLSIKLEGFYYLSLLSIFPFIYLYIKSVALYRKFATQEIWPHMIPAIVYLIIGSLTPFVLEQNEQVIYLYEKKPELSENKSLIILIYLGFVSKIILVSQAIFYLSKIRIIIRDYKNKLLDYFSNVDRKHYNWVHSFYFLFGISLLVALPLLFAGSNSLIRPNTNWTSISFVVLAIIFYIIAFLADNHSFIEESNFYDDTEKKNENKPLSSNEQLSQCIENLFKKDKVYLSKELRITEVAEKLATNRTYISQAIKNHFNTNFSSYVNSYRAEEAVSMFYSKQYCNLSTPDICEMAGFGTYSMCVKTFKEKYGSTPAALRKRLN